MSPPSARFPWAKRFDPILAFVFRSPCPLCQQPAAQVFCLDCTQCILSCQRKSSALGILNLPSLQCWGNYEGYLKQTLAKLKYDHYPQIAEPLGQWLAQLYDQTRVTQSQLKTSPMVVPIPLHCDREHQRGYNQANLIAQSFCQVTGLPLRSQGLIRTRSTIAQYGLSRLNRYQNLQRAFRLGPDLQKLPDSRPIILIDDIFTTGATLKAAVDLLQNHGFPVVLLLTVAASTYYPANPAPP